MKKRSNSRLFIFLSIVLLIAIIFRFYKLFPWLFFGMDQEYEALLVKNILTGKHFPLIGVNAADTGIYLGPGFIYLAAIPFAIFAGNPIGWAITASLLGVLVCFLIYKFGKEMFSLRVGLFASLFYSGSFLASFYDRKFWNPTLVPFLSLLLGYFLYQILKGKTNRLIFLAAVFGISLHVHLSLLIFLPLIFYILWQKRMIFSKKIIIWSILIFPLLQSPLIFFELRHDFLNSKAVINLIFSKNQQNVTSSTHIERNSLLLSALGRFFWVPFAPDLFLESGQCKQLSWLRKNAYPEGILLVLFGVIIFVWWYLHKQKRRRQMMLKFDFTVAAKIVLGIFLLTLLFVQFYNRAFFEYYLLFFFPWLAIALGKSADLVWDRPHGNIIVMPIIFLFAVLNLTTLFSSSFSYSYKDKLQAIKFAKQFVDGEAYSLETLGECSRFGGYRYLFEYLVGVPVSSYMDSYFSWLYHADTKNRQPSQVVLFSLIDPRGRKDTIAKWEEAKFRFLTEFNTLAEQRFGKIQILILTPKNNLKT